MATVRENLPQRDDEPFPAGTSTFAPLATGPMTIMTPVDVAALPPPGTATVDVLHVINGEYYAGAERVQDLLAQRLPEFGFRVEFACVKLDLFDEMRHSRQCPWFACRCDPGSTCVPRGRWPRLCGAGAIRSSMPTRCGPRPWRRWPAD